MNWNQPCCDSCWKDQHPDGREPVRLVERGREVCSWCGHVTHSGIYVRANPLGVPYPATE